MFLVPSQLLLTFSIQEKSKHEIYLLWFKNSLLSNLKSNNPLPPCPFITVPTLSLVFQPHQIYYTFDASTGRVTFAVNGLPGICSSANLMWIS